MAVIAAAQYTIRQTVDPIVSETEPENPVFGDIWLDTSQSPPKMKVYLAWEGIIDWYEVGDAEEALRLAGAAQHAAEEAKQEATKVSERLGELTVTAEAIEGRVAQTEETTSGLAERISSAESTISQQADEIALRVSKTEMEEALDNVTAKSVKTASVAIDADGVQVEGGTVSLDAGSQLNLESGGSFKVRGGEISLESGGTFTVTGGNFQINADGSVTMSGKVTAKEGSIGGWKLGADTLSAGSGSTFTALSSGGDYRIWSGGETPEVSSFSVKADGKMTAQSGSIGGWGLMYNKLYSSNSQGYVELNSSSASPYAIWAGDPVADNAPFRVKRDGTIVITKMERLTDESSGKTEIIDLRSSLWQLSHAVKTLSVQNDTLTIGLYNGQTVNFKKAAQAGALILSGGGADNFSAELHATGSATSAVVKSVYGYLYLSAEPYGSSSHAYVGTAKGSGSIAQISVGPVYDAGYEDGEKSVYVEKTSWGNPAQGYVSFSFTLSNGLSRSYQLKVPSSYM